MTNPSDKESRALISTFREFVAFMQIVRGYVGEKRESIITKFKRMTGSKDIPGKLRAAREKMQAALSMAHFATFVKHAEDEQRTYNSEQIKYVMRRLHCTNYEDHLWRYLSKSESIKNPCAWSKSHKLIADWLSTTEKSSKLFISGNQAQENPS
ncbi:hypothetical protein BJV77DRAFT_759200 [Russula vinacea]|nr:hypothetical protein BJV77DRAFT_759200 [Russula vinacea]